MKQWLQINQNKNITIKKLSREQVYYVNTYYYNSQKQQVKIVKLYHTIQR